MGIKNLQTNFTSGSFDPRLAAREDTTFYYNAAEELKNVVVEPQGGVTRRGGLQHVREITKQLEAVDLSSATLTAPQGGTAANLIDDDPETFLTTTAQIASVNPFVVAHVDLLSLTDIAAVDVVNYSLDTGALADEFFVQYSTDDMSWNNLGGAFDWDASTRSRRIRPSDALSVSARYLRVVRVGDTETLSYPSIAELKVWTQGSVLSNIKFFPFSFAAEGTAYMMAVTDKNIDILIDTDFKGSISINHTSAQLPVVNAAQTLDTMFLYHPDVAPPKIFRQGGDDEFDFRDISFEAVPQYDYGAGVGGVDEVQELNDGGIFASGDDMTLLLEGERTTTITGGASRAASATAIQDALRALPGTSDLGITVSDTAGGFEITFAGDDGSRPWAEIVVDVLTGNAVFTVSRKAEGQLPGEDIISPTRGWPRDGVIYQQRHHLVGMKGVPDAHMASVLGEYFNFEIDDELETGALLKRPDSDQVPELRGIFVGRHLTLFASDSEYYYPGVAFDREAFPVLTTRNGIKAGVRPFEVDGAILFLQEDGSSYREFLFTDTEQSYQANPISVLSSHLIKNPIDAGKRKAVNTNETDRVFLINEDGTAAVLSTLRSQEVTAFTEMFTRTGDKLLAVGVDQEKRVFFGTERTVNGVTRRFIEKLNSDLKLDGGGEVFMTYETVVGAEDQTVFNWTFDNPAEAAAIGVRVNGARLDESEYSVDLGSKGVTLDFGVEEGDIVRIASMVNEVSGLGHLAGEQVYIYLDGSPQSETYTVSSGGVLALDDYADISIEYGFFFEVYGKLMPLRVPDSQTLAGENVRVYRVLLSLFEAGHLEIRANGGKWFDVEFVRLDDDILDKSLDESLYTGLIDIKGLPGYAPDGYVEFRQTVPADLTIRSITREAVI